MSTASIQWHHAPAIEAAARSALLSTAHRYVLLDTRLLEDLAYPGLAPDAPEIPVAPSVTDLVRSAGISGTRRWLWDGSAFDAQRERGPLLIEADETSLIYAMSQWAPAGGAWVIGSDLGFDCIHRHLANLVVLTLADGGSARYAFAANTLEDWLHSLDDDQRLAWLGPIRHLVWQAGGEMPNHWHHVESARSGLANSNQPPSFHLRRHEQARFDARVHERFMEGIVRQAQALPAFAGTAPEQIRQALDRAYAYATARGFRDEQSFTQFFVLTSRYGAALDTPQAHALLSDTTQSPQTRLQALGRLANNLDLIRELRALPKHAASTPEQIQALIERARAYAESVGIFEEGDFRQFLLLTVTHPQLDTPHVHALLRNTNQSPRQRLRAMSDLVNQEATP